VAAARFVRGFKAEAERTALELRGEVGVGLHSPLDPHALAAHLCVSVMALEEIELARPADVDLFLRGRGRSDFSAATIFIDRYKRFIIYNSAHSDGRQMSSLCHELGHLILGHESEAPVGQDGQRDWNPQQENEADWLGGCLLIPAAAATAAARRGDDDAAVAQRFGVSVRMATMRMNGSGARVIARRAASARTPFKISAKRQR
jgi:hypothetical protein